MSQAAKFPHTHSLALHEIDHHLGDIAYRILTGQASPEYSYVLLPPEDQTARAINGTDASMLYTIQADHLRARRLKTDRTFVSDSDKQTAKQIASLPALEIWHAFALKLAEWSDAHRVAERLAQSLPINPRDLLVPFFKIPSAEIHTALSEPVRNLFAIYSFPASNRGPEAFDNCAGSISPAPDFSTLRAAPVTNPLELIDVLGPENFKRADQPKEQEAVE